MDDDFHERFLKANANPDFMAQQLADLLRNCVRAAAATSDPTSQTYRASETLKFLIQLMSRAESIQPFELVEKAVGQITVDGDDDPVNEAVIHAAKMGTRFLVEESCDDNAARGRAAKRRDEFLQAIKWVEEAYEERRKQYRPGL
jgi:hypothetical protein